jgi:hypothetical protein
MSNETAEFGVDRFICPRCNAYSHHLWSDLNVSARRPGGSASVHFSDEKDAFFVRGDYLAFGVGNREHTWSSSTCSSCNQSSVWRGDRIVFPSESPISPAHPDMPSDAAELYEEARAVLPTSRRAAAALARATLERLLRGLESADSKQRLDGLVAGLSGKVGEPLWKLLTALRVIGNDTLHVGDTEIVTLFLEGDAAEVAEPFFGAINAVVEELITQPRKAAELYALIPQSKREDAERKATAASN